MEELILNKSEQNLLIHIFLDIGEIMLCSGAEISRVEDTIRHMGRSYGVKTTDVWVITSAIVTSIGFKGGRELTLSRRISKNEETNLEKLEKLNELSRKCSAHPIDVAELKKQVKEIRESTVHTARTFFGSAVAAASFAMFFGGNCIDALVAALVAVLVCLLQRFLAQFCPNKMFFLFITALISGIIICGVGKIVPNVNIDKVMIGDIMLLIPGIAITNSVRNMLVGDTISGAIRLVESTLWAIALAFGFVLSMRITGESTVNMNSANYVMQIVTSFFGTLGFALLFNVSKKKILFGAVAGVVCIGGSMIADWFNLGFFVSAIFAAALCALCTEIFSRLLKAPKTIFLTPGLVPLVPGGLLYYTMHFGLNRDIVNFAGCGWKTVGYAFGISLGISLISAVCFMINKITAKIKGTI